MPYFFKSRTYKQSSTIFSHFFSGSWKFFLIWLWTFTWSSTWVTYLSSHGLKHYPRFMLWAEVVSLMHLSCFIIASDHVTCDRHFFTKRCLGHYDTHPALLILQLSALAECVWVLSGWLFHPVSFKIIVPLLVSSTVRLHQSQHPRQPQPVTSAGGASLIHGERPPWSAPPSTSTPLPANSCRSTPTFRRLHLTWIITVSNLISEVSAPHGYIMIVGNDLWHHWSSAPYALTRFITSLYWGN